MRSGLNKVMLIGWLGSAPELRRTPGGRPVAAFSLAIPRVWVAADGEQREDVDWFNVIAWDGLAEFCREALRQESQVYVEGQLRTRGWEDDQGQRHFRTEVVAHEIIVLGHPLEQLG